MTTATDTSLRLSRRIKASPDRVFRAWTDPDQLRQWSCPEGLSVADVQVDLRVGGAYRIKMEEPGGAVHTAVGTYREIDPPRRLVYTWRWEEGGHEQGDTLVTVEFEAEGEGTNVVLAHQQFPNAEERDRHAEGWTSCVNRLEGLFQ